jgi:hypothetical protein
MVRVKLQYLISFKSRKSFALIDNKRVASEGNSGQITNYQGIWLKNLATLYQERMDLLPILILRMVPRRPSIAQSYRGNCVGWYRHVRGSEIPTLSPILGCKWQ